MRTSLALAILFTLPSAAGAFEPTSAYEKREVSGFSILVHSDVLKHETEAKDAFTELESQLKKLCEAVPEKPLTELKKVRIWVEWEAKKNGAAEFHPSAGWLKDHGYNPDKAQAVEINNARNFVKWSRRSQPWMLMHELAHAYHFRVLGDKYPPLHDAFKQAKERKLYDEVDRVGAKKKEKAYAMTEPAEYFAELTEAYFGKNDFFPFNRAELEKHDPVGFALMRKAWDGK